MIDRRFALFVVAGLVGLGCSSATAQVGVPHSATVGKSASGNANPTSPSSGGVPSAVETIPTPADDIDPRTEQVLTDVYDPSGQALATFHAALHGAKAGKGQARIAWWGASHTAADLWSGNVRRALQQRFGDAGHGFMLPFRWHGGYRHQDINLSSSRGWTTLRHKLLNPVPVGDYGYGGVAIQAADSGESFTIKTCDDNVCGKRADRFELWLRAGPGGGTALVNIDGKVTPLATRARKPRLIFRRFKLRDAAHEVRVVPKGDGPLYVYGAVLERSSPGVIVDQMGIPGARGSIMLNWQEDTWREQLRRRDPHLVILAYGTNAVGDKGAPIRHFREQWRQVLERIKTAVPRASCLLVGPTDRPTRPDDAGLRHHRPRMDLVIEEQKRVAAEYGCGYWDAFAAMGGRGAMLRWVKAGLGRSDHVHLSRAGYDLKAERFLAGLLAGL